jgi:sialate O-acetylesterase
MLPKLTAGGPYTLKANNATATDILIGEVWLASGQSNMEFTLKQVTDPKAALAASDHPNLRMFTVKRAVAADPTDNLSGTWQISSPATSGDFTAVGYYFAVSLLEHLKVPIGIIHSSWGGTPAEAWTPLQNLLADPVFMATANFQSAAYHALPASLSAYKTQLPAWEAQYHAAEPAMEDPGTIAAANDWKPISFPVSTADLPFKGAAVLWLRRMVTLPDNVPSVRAHIDLGYMLERDVVYVNGQEIVKQGYGDPEIGVPSRAADIPADVLHPGANTILIRAFAHAPARQSLGHASSAITIPTSQPGVNDTYPITGQWQYHLSFDQPVPADAIASLPHSPQMNVSNTPTALYNAMIYPLRDVSIAGALWYQGESNAGAAAKYPGLMADMIKGWRTQWGCRFIRTETSWRNGPRNSRSRGTCRTPRLP